MVIQVIAGDLLLLERQQLYEDDNLSQEVARNCWVESWKTRWEENEQVAQWTKELIPDLNTWLICKHRKIDYFLCQALSRHGNLRSYTSRIDKTSEEFIYCECLQRHSKPHPLRVYSVGK